MEGIGFVALPYAVRQGGITVVIGLAVVPVIMAYTAYLLADCLYGEDDSGERRRERNTYQEIGKACWSPFKHIIWGYLTIILFIVMSSLIVLCGSLMSQHFPHVPITESQWACLGTAAVFPTVFLKRLSNIAWISLFAAFALLSVFGISLVYEFQEISHWDFHSLLFWDTRGVFVGFSIIALSFGIHTAGVTIAADVADLSRFKVALVWSYLFSASFKLVFAVSGFLTYTSSTNGIILNNLPLGIPLQVVTTCFVLNVLLSYPIFALTLLKNIEELPVYSRLENKITPKISFLLLRVIVVLATLAFAVGVTKFALISALIGSLSYCIALTFPGLFHLRLKQKKLSVLQIIADVVLIILGTICTLFGLTTTVISLASTT